MSNASQEPVIAKYKPYYAELEKGKRYFWCACGRSKNQPYCDGSHKGTGIVPLPYEAQSDGEEVLFCGCKHTAGAPFCDGSHNNLREKYETDDPLSPENQAIPLAEESAPGCVALDGSCQVRRVGQLPDEGAGTVEVRKLIGAEDGALHQSQFHLTLPPGYSQALEFPRRQVLLFVAGDSGELAIGSRRFALEPRTGAFVRPGEAFALTAPPDGPLRVYASVFPNSSGPVWRRSAAGRFDAGYPDRTIAMDRDKATPMADRFFQVLIGKRQGFENGAQFIGEIPLVQGRRPPAPLRGNADRGFRRGLPLDSQREDAGGARRRDFPAPQAAPFAGMHQRRRNAGRRRDLPRQQPLNQLLARASHRIREFRGRKFGAGTLIPLPGPCWRRINPSMELGSAIHGSHTPARARQGNQRRSQFSMQERVRPVSASGGQGRN